MRVILNEIALVRPFPSYISWFDFLCSSNYLDYCPATTTPAYRNYAKMNKFFNILYYLFMALVGPAFAAYNRFLVEKCDGHENCLESIQAIDICLAVAVSVFMVVVVDPAVKKLCSNIASAWNGQNKQKKIDPETPET